MKRRMRGCSPLGLLAAGALLLAGCGGSRSQAKDAWVDPVPLPPDTMTVPLPSLGVHGGRFVIGQISSPKTFNAPLANESSSTDVCNQIYASLTDWDYETRRDTPQIAKAWELSEDGTVYTFHLRRGAAFSDGHPITALDVLFSFEIVLDPVLHPSVQDLLQIGGRKFKVAAPDSYTVVINTHAVSRLSLSAISSVRIMPKHVLEPAYRSGRYASAYSTSTRPESLVTSGGWRLKEFRANEKTVLERNPYWFEVDERGGRLPYLDELVFTIVPDQTTNALKFQAGETDALDQINNEDYQALEEGQRRGGYTLYTLGPSINTNFMWFNLNKVREARGGKRLGAPQVGEVKYSWFREPAFRRAVSKAIDREAIIKGPFFGEGVKSWSNATPGNLEWYTPDVVHDDYDPEGAKQLLGSLGMKDGDGDGVLEDARGNPVAFTLRTNSNNNMRVQMSNMIRDDLAKVGIRVVPAPTEFNTMIVNLREDFQYDAMLLGLQSGVPPDPPGMGQNFWRPNGLTHFWNIKQPRPETPAEQKMLELLERNLSTHDRAVQRETWKEMQNTLNQECFVVYLPVQIVKVPVRDRFGNVAPSIIPHRVLWNIRRVYAKPRA